VLDRHYGHFVTPPHVHPGLVVFVRHSLENAEEGYVLSRNARLVMCLTKNSSGTYQQVLVYEGLGLNQGTGYEILKGKDTSITRRLSEAHLVYHVRPVSRHDMRMLTRGFSNQ
jgi:hypothetical protein